MIYRSKRELDFLLKDVPPCPIPGRVLMTSPDHFDVNYVINPHMAGHIGTIDRQRAKMQWKEIHDTYLNCGLDVNVIQDRESLPDMVFCANQTLPFLRATNTHEKGVVLSKMYAKERMAEVTRYAEYFSGLGYETVPLADSEDTSFEGMGDAIWHPGRHLLWGGYGFRTDATVYDQISSELDVRVLLIELTDPDFYHLDTCFSAIDEDTVLIYPGAFQPEGLEMVRALFRNVLESPEEEARTLFSCNAHCPDGKYVIIQKGCVQTNELLSAAGYTPVEVDTSEFLKAGGSVFCMKQMFW